MKAVDIAKQVSDYRLKDNHYAERFMDGLKELVEAFSARIKSPIIGSIALAFIAINWRAVFFLFFSGEPTSDKFVYFTENTTGYSLYLFPVIVGLGFALIVPWINFWGAKAIESPVTKHRNMQLDAAHTLAKRKTLHTIDMETVSAEHRKALLESAKVDQEIKEADIDEDVRADLEEKVAEAKGSRITDIAEIEEVETPLPNISKYFLKRAAVHPSGSIRLMERSGNHYQVFGNGSVTEEDIVSRKSFLDAKEAVNELVRHGYMEARDKEAFDLSVKGYSYVDSIGGSERKAK